MDVRIRTMAIFFRGKSIGRLLKYANKLTPKADTTKAEKIEEKKEEEEKKDDSKDAAAAPPPSCVPAATKDMPPLRLKLDWEAISVYVPASPLIGVVENHVIN